MDPQIVPKFEHINNFQAIFIYITYQAKIMQPQIRKKLVLLIKTHTNQRPTEGFLTLSSTSTPVIVVACDNVSQLKK